MISTEKSAKKLVGDEGEGVAERYLKSNGYSIIDRNFRCRGGEIDLIALKKGEIHFIEVKTRRSGAFGLPLEAVDFGKRQKMAKAAFFYLLVNKRWEKAPKVFSVVSINESMVPAAVEFFPNAFEIEGDYY